MKKILTSLLMAAICAVGSAQVTQPTDCGVKYVPQGSTLVTELQVYSPSIVRVLRYELTDGMATPTRTSYSITAQPADRRDKAFKTAANGHALLTKHLRADIDPTDGHVTFATADGTTLLQETTASVAAISEGVDKGKTRISQQFRTATPDEVLIGLGQRQTENLLLGDGDIDIWTGYKMIPIPYFTSERGYGLYWDNAGESKFQRHGADLTMTSAVAPFEDYYFMYDDGTQDGVVACIRHLTGDATMLPLWTMGYWQCRERYKSSDELCDVLDYYRDHRIPLDAIVQDWQYWGCDSNWNSMRFDNPYYSNKVGDPEQMRYLPPDMRQMAAEHLASGKTPRIKSPQEMVDYVHGRNAHLMISIWPDFGPWTQPYADFDRIGALFPFESWPKGAGVKVYDPWNPAARDIYWNYLSNLYEMGFDAWWTDSTEPDHTERPGDRDYPTHDGSFRSVKNTFALMSNRGIYEHQQEAEKAKIAASDGKYKGKRTVQMTRSGTFGMQRYGAFSWSGDVVSNWAVLKQQIPSGLNYVTCGLPYWNTDIGGFFGWDYNNDPLNPAMQELQVRWMQFGAFCPIMRNHCSSPMVSEIYQFGKPGDWAYDTQREYIELRYRLLPYLYATMADCWRRQGTMMRPLLFDFKNDPQAIRRNDSYMLGRQLLVRPVTDPLYTRLNRDKSGSVIVDDVRTASLPVDVYLPAGTRWFDFWDNSIHDGGQTIARQAPIGIMPVFVRAGSILPWGPAVQYSTEQSWETLDLRVYPGADGDFTLYEDEFDTNNYQQGHYSLIPMHWDDAKRTLTIGRRTGTFDGMAQQRTFRIRLIGTDNVQTVHYDGKKLRIRM